jgi:hypothetical protein
MRLACANAKINIALSIAIFRFILSPRSGVTVSLLLLPKIKFKPCRKSVLRLAERQPAAGRVHAVRIDRHMAAYLISGQKIEMRRHPDSQRRRRSDVISIYATLVTNEENSATQPP